MTVPDSLPGEPLGVGHVLPETPSELAAHGGDPQGALATPSRWLGATTPHPSPPPQGGRGPEGGAADSFLSPPPLRGRARVGGGSAPGNRDCLWPLTPHPSPPPQGRRG